MKKIITIALALVMIVGCVFSFASCSQTDSQKVEKAGKIVVGITDFAPMDYKDADGNWIGFDADMAKAFAAYLGVDVEFVEIDWDNKVLELESGAIDCVWNGMTLTDEVKDAMDCSNPYCNNAQIVVLPKANVGVYTKESIKTSGLKVAVEAGSAGAIIAKELGYTVTEVDTQAKALLEVKSGAADAAVIDSLMAAAMVGEGTGYADLAYDAALGLTTELYGVGFRQGSDLTAKLNDFFKAAWADGTMQACAAKYGVSASVIEQK